MTEGLDIGTNELKSQFSWFYSTFNDSCQEASDDFLFGGIKFKLVSVSRNMNSLFTQDSYFVTKIKVDSQHEMFIRCSDKAVNTILERALGTSKKSFKINSITELEAKIITAYNDNLYNAINKNFQKTIPEDRNYDITHLSFIIKDDETKLSGKMIFSIPNEILAPQPISISSEKFSNGFFKTSTVDVGLYIGSTIFNLKDLKMLEPEDIVVLENSNIHIMRINYKGFEKNFKITPNPGLIISVDNNEGEDAMSANGTPENLWDSIQVEMSAEFDKVRISLGELKNIEDGLVVDVGSVYNNNVTLSVENKPIAMGELVIVNDRYGVKVKQVFTEGQQPPKLESSGVGIDMQHLDESDNSSVQQDMAYNPDAQNYSNTQAEPQVQEQMQTQGSDAENSETDFDYSDFELDDEDL